MNPALPIVKQLLQQAVLLGATDLHFYPTEENTNIYVRVQGTRKYLRTIPREQYELLLTFFKFSAGMDIGESRKPQDGSILHQFPDIGDFTLRLSTMPLPTQESLAIRILPHEDILPIHELFLFPYQLEKLMKLANKEAGLILLTGPTGSGKTTTLYALIKSITKEKSYQTISLEDPIEKRIDGVIQVQINEQAGITYQSGLKAALRHDPDILMIGELRDDATAHFAFQAALTGHLVLSTIHAKNALGTIHRLLDMGIRQQDLLQCVHVVAAIQLIPIVRKGEIRRAAILEILEGEKLEKAICLEFQAGKERFQTFEHLRRKAYAYGFFPEVHNSKEIV